MYVIKRDGSRVVYDPQQVIDAISDYGFVLGNIQILSPDDVINAYSTLDKTALKYI